jgi:hypothetical protein
VTIRKSSEAFKLKMTPNCSSGKIVLDDGKAWLFGISNYGQAARVVHIYAVVMKVK